MARRQKKGVEMQGGEELRTVITVAQLLTAGARLVRTIIVWSGWDNWPHL